jgi:acyl-coenzyme A synthetase/AMP-(fatty) acid ligase
LTEDYPDNYSLTDGDVESWLAPEAMDGDAMPAVPVLPADQVMAIAFTSGSTGRANRIRNVGVNWSAARVRRGNASASNPA